MNELEDCPGDRVSSLLFTPQDQLLVTAWDCQTRLYDACDSSNVVAKIASSVPMISSRGLFSSVYTGGLDGSIRLVDLENQSLSPLPVDKLEGGVAHMVNNNNTNSLLAGSWSGVMAQVDPRTNKTLGRWTVPHKIVAMDANDQYLAVGMTNRVVHVYDHRNYSVPYQVRESGLKFQMTDLKCWDEGYALSSIDGRVAIEFYDPSEAVQAKKYAFKGHRTSGQLMDEVYPIHGLCFNAGLLYTAGNDLVCLWNFQARKRVKLYKVPRSTVAPEIVPEVTHVSVDSSGKYMAIAVNELHQLNISSNNQQAHHPNTTPHSKVYLKSMR